MIKSKIQKEKTYLSYRDDDVKLRLVRTNYYNLPFSDYVVLKNRKKIYSSMMLSKSMLYFQAQVGECISNQRTLFNTP